MATGTQRRRIDGREDAALESGWGTLWPHVLDKIWANMTEHEAPVFLLRARLVNHHWCRWATALVKHLRFKSSESLEEGMECRPNRFTAVEKLTLMINDAGTMDLRQLQQLLPFRHLVINCNEEYTLEQTFCSHFLPVVSFLTALVSLKIVRNRWITDGWVKELTALICLTRLSLRSCTKLTEKCAEGLVRMPTITDLSLKGSCRMKDVGMRHLVAMPGLTNLALSVCRNEALAAMTRLVKLELGIPWCAPAVTVCLMSLTNLRELRLPNTSYAALQALGRLSSITLLHLCLRDISDPGLKVLKQISKLANLALAVPLDGVDGIRTIAELSALVSLHLTDVLSPRGGRLVNSIQDETVALLTGLTNLTSLRLCSFFSLTERGLEALSSLTALEILRMSVYNHPRVTLASAGFLSALTRLKHFELDASTSDSGVRCLTTMTSLTELDLGPRPRTPRTPGWRGTDFTDVGMGELAKLPALSVLRLRCCPRITNAGVMHLTALRFLRRLDLGMSPGVTLNIEEWLQRRI